MATVLKRSGFLASEIAVVFSGTQQINSLTDNEWTDLSDEIDNESGAGTPLYAYADLGLVLGSAAFTGADSLIEVYLVPVGLDGTNYPGWLGNSTSDSAYNYGFWVANLPTTGTTAAQKMVTAADQFISLPNGKFKFGIRNRGNVTLASSGNTLSYRPHSFQSV